MLRLGRAGGFRLLHCGLIALCVSAPSIVALAQTHKPVAERTFSVTAPAEIVVRLRARCDACDWAQRGREAAVLSIILDDRAPITLPVARRGEADYSVLLGSVDAGSHRIRVEHDTALSAHELRAHGAVSVTALTVDPTVASSDAYRPLSLAPVLHARPNTVGRFSDVPLYMWYEVEPTARGLRYRYSVVFTNEDGGTPTDRLMATWGRTTDIEYVYSVEVDAAGTILADDIQGPKHEILPFRGTRQGRHPLLWVTTDNNMVEDRGTTSVRYAPAPVAFPLREQSREAVMDANPWLYAVASQELVREGKIADDAPPGRSIIPDPRRFLYLEGCGEVGKAALAFSLHVGDAWASSDRGLAEYRIVRDGCFRAAIPLPPSMTARDVDTIRVQAFARDETTPNDTVRFTRLNTAFMLTDDYTPARSLAKWTGSAVLKPGGPPLDIKIAAR